MLQGERQTLISSIDLKVNCERLAAELPAFMLYALAATGGRRALHEALLELGGMESPPSVLGEFSKLSKLYISLVRIYGSHVVALEKLSTLVCPNVLSTLFGNYVTLYLTKGRSREVFARLAQEVGVVFKRHLEAKLSQLVSLMEFIVALLAAMVMSIFISSFISINMNIIVLIVLATAILAAPLSIILRIEILNTYVRSARRDWALLASDVALIPLALTAGRLNFEVQLAVLLTLLTVKLVELLRLYRLINDIGSLYHMASLLAETVNVSSKDIIVKRLRSLGNNGKLLAYTLVKGRVPTMAEKHDSTSHLAPMLARIVALAGRSGGTSLAAVRLSASLLELVYSAARKLFGRFLAMDMLVASMVVTVQWALSAVMGMLQSSGTVSYIPLSLPDTATLSLFSLQLLLVGLTLSYMLTYIMVRRPWLNIAAPAMMLLSTLILKH